MLYHLVYRGVVVELVLNPLQLADHGAFVLGWIDAFIQPHDFDDQPGLVHAPVGKLAPILVESHAAEAGGPAGFLVEHAGGQRSFLHVALVDHDHACTHMPVVAFSDDRVAGGQRDPPSAADRREDNQRIVEASSTVLVRPAEAQHQLVDIVDPAIRAVEPTELKSILRLVASQVELRAERLRQ